MDLAEVPSNLSNWVQLSSWGVAILAAPLALFKYLTELRQSREQRERDHRWKQAEAGKELNDEMMDDPEASAALDMIDGTRKRFEITPGQTQPITENEYLGILAAGDSESSDKAEYVLRCFDALFYYFNALDHRIKSDLVREEDVAFPLSYYVPIMCANRPTFLKYLKHHNLVGATGYLNRFSEWREAADRPANVPG
jgi:hypothetical protein